MMPSHGGKDTNETHTGVVSPSFLTFPVQGKIYAHAKKNSHVIIEIPQQINNSASKHISICEKLMNMNSGLKPEVKIATKKNGPSMLNIFRLQNHIQTSVKYKLEAC